MNMYRFARVCRIIIFWYMYYRLKTYYRKYNGKDYWKNGLCVPILICCVLVENILNYFESLYEFPNTLAFVFCLFSFDAFFVNFFFFSEYQIWLYSNYYQWFIFKKNIFPTKMNLEIKLCPYCIELWQLCDNSSKRLACGLLNV